MGVIRKSSPQLSLWVWNIIIVGVVRKSSPMTIGSGTPSPPPVGFFEETAGSAKYFNNLYGRSGEYQKERIFPRL